ncbi:MAG: VWA domain-containing protein [Lachnospiraceae bacterium]|nr:VWA domain-containing protein [Lachnospiraceae bacterium]
MEKKTMENLKRWRLILGEDANERLEDLSREPLSLTEEELLMDSALAAIYGNDKAEGGDSANGRTGGRGMSNPQITRWLGDLRSLFEPMEITIIQNDAIERKGMKQLFFEPEMLDQLEPDINTGSLILMLKDQVPQRAKDNVREYIRKIVEEINKHIADDVKRAVTAAMNRREHSPIPSAAALDYKMTIRRNLKNYNIERNVLLPEKFYFYERLSRSSNRTVILDIDQSGSMGESVIYSSVMGCILASMNALKTHIVAFDTEIHDMTDVSSDPVDLLYGIQLGGGTDIEKSVKYCTDLIVEPNKTTMFLITDLYEGGNRNGLLRRLAELKESGVNIIVLLAISDQGKPFYDAQMAERIAGFDIPCFACPPEKLPELLELALNRKSMDGFNKK